MAGLKNGSNKKWVDIGSKKKDGGLQKCGRSKSKVDAKRKYPKCVPLAKATRMSDSQRASAVRRKRAASNTGPKTNKRKNICKKKINGIRRISVRRQDNMPARNKKNFRPTKSGAGMTRAGVAAYRRKNPGSKLKTAVTGKVKPGSKAAKRRKSFCARSLGQMKKFPKAAKDPNSRLRQARRRWKC
jgi:hypothetical protein